MKEQDMEIKIIEEAKWAEMVAVKLCKEIPQLIHPNMDMLEIIKFVLDRKDKNK